jgi:hypothetical protein
VRVDIVDDDKDNGQGRGATRRSRTVAKEESGSVGGGERNPMLSDAFVAGGGHILMRTTTTRDDGDEG